MVVILTDFFLYILTCDFYSEEEVTCDCFCYSEEEVRCDCFCYSEEEVTCDCFCYSEDDDAEDEGSSEEDTLCAVCSEGGTLVCCDSCPLSYHLTCTKPVLKKIPKGKWLCQICTGKDTKSGKIKMNLMKG